MATIASFADVAVALGRSSSSFTSEQQAQIQHLLNGVELLIVARLGPVAALDAATVKYVEAQAVAEKFSGGGRRSSSETVTVDDASVTRRYDGASAGDISDDLWALFASGDVSTAYTIGVTSPRDLP